MMIDCFQILFAQGLKNQQLQLYIIYLVNNQVFINPNGGIPWAYSWVSSAPGMG